MKLFVLGINMTEALTTVVIERANITQNRGYGVYMNASRGSLTLRDSSVTANMADGVFLYRHDFRPITRVVEGLDVHDFCTYSTTHSQTYPLLMVAEQYTNSAVDRYSSYFYIFNHLMNINNQLEKQNIKKEPVQKLDVN